MPAEPRRAWSGIRIPADLHAVLTAQTGPRGLTAAVTAALHDLVRGDQTPVESRPARDGGTVEITLRLPVELADAADRWRARHQLSRQATVEYAVLYAVGVQR
jgi:hypothetical protein